MRIYVDDMRNPKTDGWVICRTYEGAVDIIEANWHNIEYVSLDHDLGTDLSGYDIAVIIERLAFLHGGCHFTMNCHSANPVGCANINAAIKKIQSFR
jgi:hypothetical protein